MSESTAATRQVTRLLARWGEGDRAALDELTPLIYSELRKLAKAYLRRERSDHTLEGTALVHEAYLRLVDQRSVEWRNRSHFFSIAAELIRRILVDHARARLAEKRGGQNVKISVDDALGAGDRLEGEMSAAGSRNRSEVDLLGLDDALTALAKADCQQSRIVELRFFGGLTIEETASILNISPATVKRDWVMAKAFLKREMTRAGNVG